MTRSSAQILENVLAGGRLSDSDAVTLLDEGNLLEIGAAAQEVRNRKNDPSVATYIVDRNINYTNVCVYRCQFCAFYRPSAEHPEAYVLSHEQIGEKIQETIDLAARASCSRAASTRACRSRSTRTCSASSGRRSRRSTSTPSRRRRSTSSRS
jgi:2-iminoacetate synthase ThiH